MKPSRILLILGPLLLLCAPSRPAKAATVVVPPVTITELIHSESGGWVSDAVTFPGTGYTSEGFSATIALGDTIIVRFQAPQGKKFVVHAGYGASATEQLYFHGEWKSGPLALILTQGPLHFTLENFKGQSPLVTNYLNGVTGGAYQLLSYDEFLVMGDFEFTALQIDIVVVGLTSSTSGVFGSVIGDAGTRAPVPNGTLMAIVDDDAVPTATTTWGRVKTLYR